MRAALVFGRLVSISVLSLWFGCSSSSEGDAPASGGTPEAGSTPQPDAGAPTDDATAPKTLCPRSAKSPDRVRHVVVSHPFDSNAGKANDYEVLTLGTDGSLSQKGTKFQMGNNFDSSIVFTPDGEIGASVHDKDGTIGFFRIDEAGAVTVIDPAFGLNQFYADAAVFSPDGSRLYVIDGNRFTSGGVHEIEIGCDGKPTYKGRIATAGSPSSISFVPGTSRVAVMALSAEGLPKGHDLFFLDVASTPTITESLALFGDEQISSHGIAFSPDGKLGIVADGNEVLGTKRVGTFTLDGAPKKLGEFEIEGPTSVVVSPYGNAAIVTAAGGGSVDAIYTFSITGSGSTATVSSKGKLAPLVGAKPQLPTCSVMVESGALKGLVLVGEVEGIRRVRFEASGSVTDLGVFTIPGELEAVVGCVGLQP